MVSRANCQAPEYRGRRQGRRSDVAAQNLADVLARAFYLMSDFNFRDALRCQFEYLPAKSRLKASCCGSRPGGLKIWDVDVFAAESARESRRRLGADCTGYRMSRGCGDRHVNFTTAEQSDKYGRGFGADGLPNTIDQRHLPSPPPALLSAA